MPSPRIEARRPVNSRLRVLAPFLASMLALPAVAEEVFPVSRVRPGMRGYGITVFSGQKPERFEVEALGVLRNFLPAQDVILARLGHPILEKTSVIAGMSGSPVYFDGRLAGAVAYAWGFSKEPIAGITPIESMLGELERPTRGPASAHFASRRDWMGPSLPAADRWLAALPAPFRGRSVRAGDLSRAAVPLSASGLGPRALAEAARLLEPFSLIPMQAGGGGDPARRPASLAPGAPIGVQLVRGDVSMTGTGTVTAVRGNRVLAFGHPMFQAGEIYLPIVGAEIHSVLPSVARSFKISSPLGQVGSLVQDRQSCIIGELGRESDMLPVEVRVTADGEPSRALRAEVVRHRFLAPALAELVVGEGAWAMASDWADTVYTMRVRLDVRGHRALEIVDHVFSREGLTPRALAGARGMAAVGVLLNNPFEPLSVDRIRVDLDISRRPDYAEITDVHVSSHDVNPGARINVYATVRPFAGGEETRAIPIEVPRYLAGATLRVEVAAGGQLQPNVAPPDSVADLLGFLETHYPQNAMVVSIYGPDESVTVRGEVVASLPPSVLDTLRPAASGRFRGRLPDAARTVVPTNRVLAGRADLLLQVRKEVLR